MGHRKPDQPAKVLERRMAEGVHRPRHKSAVHRAESSGEREEVKRRGADRGRLRNHVPLGLPSLRIEQLLHKVLDGQELPDAAWGGLRDTAERRD